MDDLISRKKAMDIRFSRGINEDGLLFVPYRDVKAHLESLPPAELGTNLAEVGTRAVIGYPIDADALMEKVAEEYGERARDTLYRIIRHMPPAQSKKRTEERTETHACDSISRRAAIDAVNSLTYPSSLMDVKRKLIELPPAEPELIECDPVKACIEATMNKVFSAYRYLSMLEDLKVYGYVLAKRSEVAE